MPRVDIVNKCFYINHEDSKKEDCREKWATNGKNNNQMSLKEKEKAVAADKIRKVESFFSKKIKYKHN